MKGLISILIIILCLPLILGMGAPLRTPVDKIPVPEHKFNSIYIDQMDVIAECSDVSIEGATFLQGRIGEGIYTVSFDKIREIVFRKYGEKLYGNVKLRDGSVIELEVDKDKRAYGMTNFGTFQIRLNDLKKMTIEPAMPKKN